MFRPHTVVQLGSSAPSKPAPSAIQPPSGLSLIKPEMPVLTPAASSLGEQSGNPEDAVTPQLPAVAGARIQEAQQRRESAPNSDNVSPDAQLKELNSTTDSAKY